MKYYWCKSLNNFGDELTPYIVEKLTGEEAEFNNDFGEHIFLVGSILQEATDNTTVLGSGFGAADQCIKTKPKILSVRGPISKAMVEAQGFSVGGVLGDPGLILPHIYFPSKEKKHRLGIIPHYIDKNAPSIVNFSAEGSTVIDIQAEVETVIDNIMECEYTISSTLHGLITSHIYGVPSMWVEFSDNVAGDGMKFYDYFASVGMPKFKPLDCRDAIPKILMIPETTVSMDQTEELYNYIEGVLNE